MRRRTRQTPVRRWQRIGLCRIFTGSPGSSQALQEGEERVGEPVPAWAGPRSPLPASRCHPGAGRRSRQPATRGGRAGPTLGSGDLRGAVPAQLLELGGRGAGGLVSALRGGLGGGGVVAGGFCLGDLGADGGRVQARGLVPGGAGQNGGQADQGVEGGHRVLVADGGAGRAGAGTVVVAAGAVGAAELAGPARARAAGRGLPPGRLPDASAAARAIWVGGADPDDPG